MYVYAQDTKCPFRNRVLEFQKSFPSKFDVAIYTNTDSLKRFIAGITTLEDALKAGQVELHGNANNLEKFVRHWIQDWSNRDKHKELR
jgi:alkyl sulfatase BDS1-like metallo-beta-lactamase superfamily hydrolase